MWPDLVTSIALLIVALDPIGSALSDGVQLVYEADGMVQQPWTYDSVQVIPNAGFERCIRVVRSGQEARQSCARGDTLFERTVDGQYRVTRPIGAGMEIEVQGRNGQILTFSTGARATREVDGRSIDCLPTTVVTRDSAGVTVRRLREQYAPSLLTAVWGVFEVPEGHDAWRVGTEFILIEIRSSSPES